MKIKTIFVCGLLAVMLALIFTACGDVFGDGDGGNNNSDNYNGGNNDDGGNGTKLPPGELPEGSLYDKLKYIASQSYSNVEYNIVIDSDLYYGHILDHAIVTSKGKNVTVHIHSASVNDIKTINLIAENNIFDVVGVTLKLSNITLKGITNTNNRCAIVYVRSGGTLIIEDGTLITGNEVIPGYDGSGVYLDEKSTLIMNGGKISGNYGDVCCGVGVTNSSTFIMNGGEISGNTANLTGGGVLLYKGSTFIMNGGEISGNSAENGGGVMLMKTDSSHGNSSFTMNGGTIKNNSASDSGGGIYAVDKILTMNGGGNSLTVSITGGEITGNTAKDGGGVALYNSRLTKTGGYISGTDVDMDANDSTGNYGDAIMYCLDFIFWERKLSLNQNDNISTNNLNDGWTYLGHFDDLDWT